MRFIPSPASYGDTESAGEPVEGSSETGYSKYLDMLNQVAPSLSILLAGQDPREKEAVLEARLLQYQQLKASTSSLITQNYYTSQINAIQAELSAVREQAGSAEETERIVRIAKFSGLIAAGLGVVVLLQVARYYGAKTAAAKRSA